MTDWPKPRAKKGSSLSGVTREPDCRRDPPLSLTPGTRLGPYEVVSAIGEGGMGEVFRARDTKLNRNVAIKVLPAAFAQDHERVARFKREAQTLREACDTATRFLPRPGTSPSVGPWTAGPPSMKPSRRAKPSAWSSTRAWPANGSPGLRSRADQAPPSARLRVQGDARRRPNGT